MIYKWTGYASHNHECGMMHINSFFVLAAGLSKLVGAGTRTWSNEHDVSKVFWKRSRKIAFTPLSALICITRHWRFFDGVDWSPVQILLSVQKSYRDWRARPSKSKCSTKTRQRQIQVYQLGLREIFFVPREICWGVLSKKYNGDVLFLSNWRSWLWNIIKKTERSAYREWSMHLTFWNFLITSSHTVRERMKGRRKLNHHSLT